MHYEPWMIMGSPQVAWYLPEDPARWPAFRHLSTQVTRVVGAQHCGRGHAVWAASVEGQMAVLAWDWAEISPGVPVLIDPNTVLSNIRFQMPAPGEEAELVATVRANRIVHGLDWQGPVRELMAQVRTGMTDPDASHGALYGDWRRPEYRPGAANPQVA